MLRKPGRYGTTFVLKEQKVCDACYVSETRLDAQFCCWCGAKFSVVIVESFTIKTMHVPTFPVPIRVDPTVPAGEVRLISEDPE